MGGEGVTGGGASQSDYEAGCSARGILRWKKAEGGSRATPRFLDLKMLWTSQSPA